MNNRRGSRPFIIEQQKILRASPKSSGVSDYRKATIQDELNQGLVKPGRSYETSKLHTKSSTKEIQINSPKINRGVWIPTDGGISMGTKKNIIDNSKTAVGAIVHSESYIKNTSKMVKQAAVISSGATGTAGSNVERLAPEVYSPLFTMANLNLPRDRITVNAWVRNFFQLHPIVRNAITLHATYPISKLNLKCHDKKVLQFHEDMAEEMGLMETLGDIALEYWKIGECFPYSELDENTGKWSRIVIQNPDYILCKKTVLSGEPIISLRPDAVLQRLVFSNNPADIQLRRQIPEKIIYHVRAGHNIPLDNFNVSHLKMLASPYDIRGTSIIVSAFKDLMLYDKLRECFSIDTEVLTNNGFKFYDNITSDDKIATMNPKTRELEFQKYINRTDYEFDGKLYHFCEKNIDIMVTSNHRMWLSKKKTYSNEYYNFDFIKAEDVKIGNFKSIAFIDKYIGKNLSIINIKGKKVPIEDYLEFLGYIISENCIFYNENKHYYNVYFCQNDNKHLLLFKNSIIKINKSFGINIKYEENSSLITNCFFPKEIKQFIDEIDLIFKDKIIPNWIKQLSPRLLKILLKVLFMDDSKVVSKCSVTSYSTISKKLADDIQEILFKCGYVSNLVCKKYDNNKEFYLITWFISNYEKYPIINNKIVKRVPYRGRVFCFEVPNSLFVTRRNGLITIQGNSKFAQADGLVNPITIIKLGGSTDGEYRATQEDIEYFRQIFEEAQYDKDFKLITHAGITVERVGASGQVLEIAGDMELIIKNIYTGLMVPPAIVDTESAVYASASIGLEVLRQRYFNFRNIIARWLVEKIFAPISEIQGFYEFVGGKKRLIVPEIEWNQMNLYDLQDYIGNITGLVGSKQASLQTLYRSLGLNYEDEKVKLRQEMIDEAIRRKEEQTLATMTLTELRGLDPDREILEPIDDEQREQTVGPPGGAPGEMGGFPELAPPPGGELSMPGAGAPEGGMTPPLGPGTPGAAPKIK